MLNLVAVDQVRLGGWHAQQMWLFEAVSCSQLCLAHHACCWSLNLVAVDQVRPQEVQRVWLVVG
jgi:hypothetical protein